MKTDSLKVDIESKLVIRTNELIDENIRLKEQLRWISVSERLPEIGNDVLVLYKNGCVDTCVRLLDEIDEPYFHDGIDYIDDDFITHWLPIPPLQ